MKINFEKLKSAMDDDGDFIIDEIISAGLTTHGVFLSDECSC
jgi:hypothetical protein|tara:strand:- start:363 stop:488 length:126 start_codon:yes stop_codon:yes gene_type:complete